MAFNDRKGERFQEFIAEAEDILNNMGKELLRLGKGVKAGVIDPSVLSSIFRLAHTLKGMSGIFDIVEVTSLSHSVEDTLDLLRMGKIALNDEVLDSVLNAHEVLSRIIASRGEGDSRAEVASAQERLAKSYQFKKKETDGEAIGKEILSLLTEYEEHRLRESLREGKNIYIINVSFPMSDFDKGYLAMTDALKSDSEVVATLPSSKSTADILSFDVLTATARDKNFLLGLLKGITDARIRALSEPQAAAEPVEAAPPPVVAPSLEIVRGSERGQDGRGATVRRVSDTVRVNISKLDNIMNIISELGVIKSNIAAISLGLKGSRDFSAFGIDLSRFEKGLEKKLSELRDSVLDVRMVPIAQLFSRFETFIGKLSRDCGKEIRLTVKGAETELDKLIVEEIADPLMHIIRNVADHAIEPPLVRESLGKPKAGTITLSAAQKLNHVIVTVEDDGAGIDEEILKKKALERGLITEEYASRLSRQEALELIFLPGFSTRDVVTETSGRGVGMDVVKENITRLSGIIDIDTAKGKGTRFMLTIPITLAIIQVLLVEDSGVRYAVPLTSVIEILELKGSDPFDMEFLMVGEKNVPAIRLSSFFGKESDPRKGIAYGIVAGLAEHRVCVIVDRLVEELDVVVKPLPRILSIQGIAGATDMGEKGTVLVLDITGILEEVLKEKKLAVSVRIA